MEGLSKMCEKERERQREVGKTNQMKKKQLYKSNEKSTDK